MNTMNNDPTPNKPPQPPQPPKYTRSLLGWVVIIALGLLLAAVLSNQLNGAEKISLTEFWIYVDNNQIDGDIVIEQNKVRGQVKESVPLSKGKSRKFYTYFDEQNQTFSTELQARLKQAGSPAKVNVEPRSWWSGILPQLLVMAGVILFLWFFLFRRIGAAGGGAGFLGNFGRSRHRVMTKEQSRVTFKDVAGIEEAKEEVAELIEFLKNPKKFSRLGGRVPRGVLLVGEPGCGKTLLAKAIAGEADVPFFSISGSDFVEMFVGVGASRVRDLFKQAKDSAPCIIFLDEIDAVGRKRGVGFNGGGHDEREQTLNAILVEMDGFDSSDQVIVIAATNRADVLDPALTRPGRFDRQINVPLPDLKGRMEILKIYTGKVLIGPDVDLQRLARGTPMFSGADLEALVNEAAIAATMAEKDHVEQDDLEEARDKVRWGRSRKSRVIDEAEKEITAYHEAGHALVQQLLPKADPLHKVSIIPRGPMGGATFSLPEKDRYLYTRGYCQALLQVCLAGRLAEELFCDDISSGAQNDIAKATEIAKKMVLDWGMSEKLGMVNYVNDDQRIMPLDMTGKDYSEKTAEAIDEEVRRFVDEARVATRALLEEHSDAMKRLAAALMKYETLSAEEVKQVIDGKELDKPTVNELLAAEKAKSDDKPAETSPKLRGSTPPAIPEPG
ncbi:MAG: ATP-dependent zinc metalloprotease FtsH [Phycisphaerae bacterium]|nr:ATP-dependent zinc metalloprotease FtsH [Phycisphaerae bacterium]